MALLVLAALWRLHAAGLPLDPADHRNVTVTVEQGMTAWDVGHALRDRGVIRSARAFARLAAKNNVAASIKAGTYAFRPSQTLREILDSLVDGQHGAVVLTVPEGFTVKDIDALLADAGLAAPGDAQACANACDFSAFAFLPPQDGRAPRGGRVEGYLYPDTYFVDPQAFAVDDFLRRLLATFQERVVIARQEDIARSGHALQDIVTMASLIEEETRTAAERPVVSGILWKRFSIGMGLQVDATVRYILEKPTATITASDLQTDSPYNTRRYRGLPPGPIANPGISSIEAALRPEDTPYLYYLHGSDGAIHYAETNEGHNANRARYL